MFSLVAKFEWKFFSKPSLLLLGGSEGEEPVLRCQRKRAGWAAVVQTPLHRQTEPLSTLLSSSPLQFFPVSS